MTWVPPALGEDTKLRADKQLAGEEQSGCRLNRLGADSLGDPYKMGIFSSPDLERWLFWRIYCMQIDSESVRRMMVKGETEDTSYIPPALNLLAYQQLHLKESNCCQELQSPSELC